MKVGDYVRTKQGYIAKIEEEYDNCYSCDNTIEFIYEPLVFISKDKINDIVVKSSPNIIDLIEVGDYVDGQEVRYIDKGNGYCYLAIDEDYTYLIAGYDKDGLTMPIKSIVTKECFESMEYKVKE